MNKNKIRILMIPSDLSGVGSYRNIWPAQAIEKYFSDEIDVEINHQPNIDNIEYFQSFDIIHFHRHIGPYEKSAELFSKIKEKGTILVMDIDDFWEPPSTHPLYEVVKRDNFAEKIINNLKLSDYVTTTTSVFAKYISKYNPNVMVIPNALNMEHPMWTSEVEENKTEKCRISWIGGSCYDNKTEVLTDSGFKFFEDLNKNEKIACLNPETNELEYHKPNSYIREKFTGKLNCGKNSVIDYAVTPNHKMYASIVENLENKNVNFSLIPSENIHKKNMHLKKDAEWNVKDVEDFILPKLDDEKYENPIINFQKIYDTLINQDIKSIDPSFECFSEFEESIGSRGYYIDNETLTKTKSILRKSKKGNHYLSKMPTVEKYKLDKVLNMNLWLKFLGFWMAEGWTTKTNGLYQVGIAQKKDNSYLSEMFDILTELGFSPKYTKDGYQVRVFDKQLWSYLRQFGNAHEKFIPREILNLSKSQLSIFLDWFLKGDGNIENGGTRFDKREDKSGNIRGEVKFNSNRKRAYTSSRQLSDDIQEICLRIGVISTITNRGKKNCIMKDGRLVSGNHDAYTISVGSSGIRSWKNPLLKKEDQFQIDYDDYVYCVNVPHNIIFVRRNGKTMWCGNSHLHDLELMRPGFQQLWSNKELKDKFQIVMCGFDTRGSITEISPNGERRTRPIKPHETIWRKFEEIFTSNFKDKENDPEYYKWLDKIQKASDDDYKDKQYLKNYIRRWTLPLTQYGKHYDYCDVCLAPLVDVFLEEIKHQKKDGSTSIQVVKRPHIFNEVKSELKIIEAGMKKKVLIAQDFGIYSELIEDGKTGLLVKDDKKDWYKHMKRLIEDVNYREELANNLHEFVKDKYNIVNVTKDRVECYKKIIKEKSEN